jgi:uncharacterized protein YndB with AHSA1/START domain
MQARALSFSLGRLSRNRISNAPIEDCQMATVTKSTEFVISRVLDAPRDLVWKCFTDPKHMRQWWGPERFTVVASKMALRVGGTYHYGLQAPNGAPMWGKFVFREIVPPERLDFISSFSDEEGGTTRHPGHKSWPLETREDQPLWKGARRSTARSSAP